MWQAPGPCCSTLIQTASWSQSTRISTTRWVWPELSPFFQSALREREKYQASPVSMVRLSASAFMCATISTRRSRHRWRRR